MKERFLKSLIRTFPYVDEDDIRSIVALSELSFGDERLAFRAAKFDIADASRREYIRSKRFVSLEDILGTVHEGSGRDEGLERLMEEEEWRAILSSLPLPARMLAHIARVEAEGFAQNPKWTLTRDNRYLLMRQIQRRFIAWSNRHTYSAFRKARNILVAALRRHRAVKRNGRFRAEL